MSVSAGSSTGDRRQLVVCCSSGDLAQLEPAFHVLGAKGYEIATVDAVEVRTPALIEQIRRHGTRATYVVATSPELDDTRAARLMTVLRSTDVPAERIVKVEIDWRDPMALLQALQETPGPEPASKPKTVTGSTVPVLRKHSRSRIATKREQTGPLPTVNVQPKRHGSRTPTGPLAPPPPSLTTQTRMNELARRSATSSAKPLPKLQGRAEPPGRKRTPVPKASTTQSPEPPEEPKQPETTPDPNPDREPVAHEQAFTALGTLPTPSLTDSPTEAAPPAPEPSEPTRAAPPAPAPSGPTQAAPSPVEREAPRPKPESTPTLERLRLVTASLKPLAVATGGRARHAAQWLVGSRTRLAVAGTTVGLALCVAAFAWIAGETTDAQDDDATQPATSSPADMAESDDSEPEIEPPEDPAPSPQELIAQAQARGELGIADGIVFAPIDPPKRAFDQASESCRNSRVAGQSRWRLATLSELHALALAHAVEWGPYWSSTEAGNFGDRALIWNEKKSRAVPIGKRWRGARALCVLDVEEP